MLFLCSIFFHSLIQNIRENMGYGKYKRHTIDSIDELIYSSFGELRITLSDLTWLYANIVFHGGWSEDVKYKKTIFKPFIPQHTHKLQNAKDMLPWLWLTTQINSNHTRAYSIGSYWLSFYMNKADIALRYINEGIYNNPDNYQLYFMKGRILFTQKRDIVSANKYFRKAAGCEIKDDEDFQEVHRYLAFSYELIGDFENAVNVWELLYKKYPKEPKIGWELNKTKKHLTEQKTLTEAEKEDLKKQLDNILDPTKHYESNKTGSKDSHHHNHNEE